VSQENAMVSKETFKPMLTSVSSSYQEVRHEAFHPLQGEVFWELRDGDSVQTGHMKNMVTLDAGVLLARLLKGTGVIHQSEPSWGAYVLAVGTGDIGWDPLAPPGPTNTQRSLFNELARKTFSSASFITSTGSISGVPTNIIDLTATFSMGEATGPWMEMGILGGDVDPILTNRNPVLPPNGIYDPTVDLVGKDTLVNYISFPVISKSPTGVLTWTWRLSF
jgi:hypothetical protein